ncbi:MAG: hypothetical protein COA47_02890 [Robiginitomaculum sp.]|nr:MAG: hypothetical protein COA47_02890 [Robiginitomaculum sp.]
MTLDRSLLHHFVRDALGAYTENFRGPDRQSPISLTLNGTTYSLHISYIHDAHRQNPDEYRIQIDRHEFDILAERQEAGHRIAFMGVFEGGGGFVGWEPLYAFSLTAKKRVSLYCRLSQLAAIETNQSSVYEFKSQKLGKRTGAIALAPNILGFYLENLESFHDLTSEDAVKMVLTQNEAAYTENTFGDLYEFEVTDGDKREKFTYERKAYPRDPRFKKSVLGAYEKRCCICDRQLGIVQAAHIIPHSEKSCPNSVQNGLALCIEHHRLYDDALLLPAPNRKLFFNTERAEYLCQTGQGRGLDEIKELSRRGYSIPAEARFQPLDEYLQRGLDLRLAG